MENILTLETMKEGHDGSGLGLIMKDLGRPFEDLKSYPILSGSCTKSGNGSFLKNFAPCIWGFLSGITEG
jgi:hypothetical protein